MIDSFDYSSLNSSNRRRRAINVRLISYILGKLLLIEAGMFLICMGVSLFYEESDYIYFIYTLLINVSVGTLLILMGRKADRRINQRDGYIIVTVTWILFTTFGMLPFYISGYIPSITDAFFETMSGFTTTGASVVNDIESFPHGMLFWRSLTNWIGGLGIVLFTIAFFPLFNGCSQQLFLSESTGVTHDKIQPRAELMARYIWYVYIALTIIVMLLLFAGGMNLFDAICHSFATTATGGFSTKQDSIAHWNSAYIEYVVAIFMIASGVNFTLYYFMIKGKIKALFKDEEFHWFIKSVLALTAIITIALYFHNDYDLEKAFRKALFQVATTHTSCGFATDDYNTWPPFTWLLLVFAMVSGGCTGSTSGGIKNLRLVIISKNILNHFKHILHPRAVLPIRVNKNIVSSHVSSNVYTFVFTYLACVFVGWVLLMSLGVGFLESLGTVVSAIGNVGPGLGAFGPAFTWASMPDAGKWILSVLMMLGRLEIFGILLLFYKGLWADR